jgi:uncharacterized membrane protein YphA (DoxX/SURF4 family)
MQTAQLFIWGLRLVAAALMLQSLFFKFSGAEESIYIFSTLGLEPWGRIGTGVAELIASALILIPRTTGIGALLATGIMSGAIVSHLTKLGIVVKDDGGQLFIYALVIFFTSVALVIIHREQVLRYVPSLK